MTGCLRVRVARRPLLAALLLAVGLGCTTRQAAVSDAPLPTEGGPYLVSIDGLVDRRELPASGTTVILYSVSDPGRHTMRADVSTDSTAAATHATATLDVRPVGSR